MNDGRKNFSNRLKALSSRHSAMGRGYTASMRGDGLIVVEPRRIAFRMPVRGFVILMAVFMIFKGFMLSTLGADVYASKLTVLRAGSVFEQAGAFIMGIDPVSEVIARGFNATL